MSQDQTQICLDLPVQKIDYENKIVRGKDLDLSAYNRKLELWDYVIKNNLLQSDNEVIRNKCVLLLKDTTIYTKSFLKNADGEPFTLFAFQDAIASCVMEYTTGISDPMHESRYICIQGSNQIGKTGLEKALIIKRFFNEQNINILLITNRKELTSFILSDIKIMINNSTWGSSWKLGFEETENNQTTLSVTGKDDKGNIFINRIIIAPAGEGSLGYPVHYMFLDECDFYEDGKRLFWHVFMPRMKFTKGQIVAISNPNPELSRESSLLWEMVCGQFFRRKFHFMFLDNPRNTREEYEFDKKSSPSYIFSSTHDGEFSAEGGGFFSQSEIKDMLVKEWRNEMPIVDCPVYIGIDFAKVKDRTVLSIGTIHENKDDKRFKDLHVRYVYQFPLKTDYEVCIEKLGQIVTHYKENYFGVAAVGFDATGVGKAIDEMIQRNGIKAVPVVFSLQSKSRMYGNFKMLAENRRIKIVHSEDVNFQLSSLIFNKTSSGYLQVHHETESQHDDIPDSIVALIDVSILPSRIPVVGQIVVPKTAQFNDVQTVVTGSTQNDVDRYYANVIKNTREKWRFGGMSYGF